MVAFEREPAWKQSFTFFFFAQVQQGHVTTFWQSIVFAFSNYQNVNFAVVADLLADKSVANYGIPGSLRRGLIHFVYRVITVSMWTTASCRKCLKSGEHDNMDKRMIINMGLPPRAEHMSLDSIRCAGLLRALLRSLQVVLTMLTAAAQLACACEPKIHSHTGPLLAHVAACYAKVLWKPNVIPIACLIWCASERQRTTGT